MGIRFILIMVLVGLCPYGLARADSHITLSGAFTQGGLVIGQVPPGSTVQLDGRALRVSRDGRFVMGFGRDAASSVQLVIAQPGRPAETRTLAIASRTYDIQRIDGLAKKKVTPPPEELARIKSDSAAIGGARRSDLPGTLFASGFQWPAKGRISGVFGSQRVLNGKPRRPHVGVDVAAPVGTLVRATANGLVTLARQDMFFTGKTVILDHGHGLTSVYAHMSKIVVSEGQLIKKGEKLGAIGASGRVTGPHLHWGLTWFSTHLDPVLAIDKTGQTKP